MLAATPYITTMFSNIVVDTNVRWKAAAGPGADIHYEHGHPQEIIDTLILMSKNPTISALKYPLIALFQDYDEKQGEKVGVLSKIDFHLIIAIYSDKNWKAAERITKSFIPFLYLIYGHLMKSIAQSGYFVEGSVEQIKRTKTDRLYWGKTGLWGNEGNIFADCIDAIEITGLQLSVKNLICNL